jgi:hypothetical protein
MLCRVPVIWHSAKFLIFFKKIVLPSVRDLALGKAFYFLKNKYFAECPRSGTPQRILFF